MLLCLQLHLRLCVGEFMCPWSPVSPISVEQQVSSVYEHPIQKRWKKLRRFLADGSHRCVVFPNEHSSHTAPLPSPGESTAGRNRRAVATAVRWFGSHLEWTGVPVVFLSEDEGLKADIVRDFVPAQLSVLCSAVVSELSLVYSYH